MKRSSAQARMTAPPEPWRRGEGKSSPPKCFAGCSSTLLHHTLSQVQWIQWGCGAYRAFNSEKRSFVLFCFLYVLSVAVSAHSSAPEFILHADVHHHAHSKVNKRTRSLWCTFSRGKGHKRRLLSCAVSFSFLCKPSVNEREKKRRRTYSEHRSNERGLKKEKEKQAKRGERKKKRLSALSLQLR